MRQIFEIDELRAAVGIPGLVRTVEPTSRGHVRIETAFSYPDGSTVDLYLARRDDLLEGVTPPILTDFGNSLSWLMDLNIFPHRTKRRAHLLSDIIETYQVNREGAALQTEVIDNNILDALVRLSQACIRVTDLSFTQRFVTKGRFSEEVEDFLADIDADYEPDAEVAVSGKLIRVDFSIRTRRSPIALMTLPSDAKAKTLLRQRAEHVFTTFYDLQRGHWDGEMVAALDDREAAYEQQDLDRIDDVATIVSFSDRQALAELLRAA